MSGSPRRQESIAVSALVPYPTGTTPSQRFRSYDFMRSANDIRQVMVPVTRLDRFIEETGMKRLDLVEVDVETSEPLVLGGMMCVIENYRPTILCEVLPGRGSESKLEYIFRTSVYRFYVLTPLGPVKRDHVEGHPQWLNYMFVPPGSENALHH